MSGFEMRPMFSKGQFNKMLAKFHERVIEKIILLLIRAGEFFVSYARMKGSYSNLSGNLRSSIGYIIVNAGQIVRMSDFQPIPGKEVLKVVGFSLSGKEVKRGKLKDYSGVTGSKTGRQIAQEIAAMYPSGIVLIGVAGMEYGKYVEAMEYDVITGAAIATEAFLKRDIMAVHLIIRYMEIIHKKSPMVFGL